jgi:TP901 family phage tail tape measure protein
LPAFDLTANVNLRASNISATVQSIQQQLNGLTANITINVAPNSATAISIIHTRLQALIPTLNAVTTSAQQAAVALNAMSSVFKGIQLNVQSMTSGISSAAKSIAAIGTQAVESSSAVERFGEQTGKLGIRFLAFSTAATAVIGFIQALRSGIGSAVDFEREMLRLQQVGNDSAQQIKGLQDSITAISTSLGVSSGQLAKASVLFRGAGFDIDEVRSSLEALSKTELAPQFKNPQETTEGIIAIRAQFGIAAADIEKSLSAINAVSARFAAESGDMISAIRDAGGSFKAAGGDINQFLALFTSVRATTRESADSIANALRTIFARLQRPETGNAFHQLGIDLRDANGQFVGAYQAIEKIHTALSGIATTDPRFAKIAEDLGGFRNLEKTIALIQQFPLAQQAYIAAQQGANSLTEQAEKTQGNLVRRLGELHEKFLDLGRTIVATPTFQNFARTALDLAESLVQLTKSLTPLLPLLQALAYIKIGQGIAPFLAGAFKGASTFPVRGFAGGGLVPGSGNTDNFPAKLTPGEFVLRKDAVQALGVDRLDEINRKKFADGGVVRIKPNTVGVISLNKSINNHQESLNSSDKDVRRKLKEIYGDDTDLTTVEGSYELSGVSPKLHDTVFNVVQTKFPQMIRSVLGTVLRKPDQRSKVIGNFENNQEKLYDFFGGKSVSGNVFEGSLSLIKGQITKSTNEDFFDFHNVEKGAFLDFATLSTDKLVAEAKPADVRKENIRSKIFNEVIAHGASLLDQDPTAISPTKRKELLKRHQDKLPTLSQDIEGLEAEYKKSRSPAVLQALRDRKVPGYQSGGFVDSVPALLTPGEYIINREAAQHLGRSNLDKLNNVRRFATGGPVQNFAEGGLASAVGGGAGLGLLLISQLGGLNNEFGKATQSITQFIAQVGSGTFIMNQLTQSGLRNTITKKEETLASEKLILVKKQEALETLKNTTIPGLRSQLNTAATPELRDEFRKQLGNAGREKGELTKNIGDIQTNISETTNAISGFNKVSYALTGFNIAISAVTTGLNIYAQSQSEAANKALENAHTEVQIAQAQTDIISANKNQAGAQYGQLGATGGSVAGGLIGGAIGGLPGYLIGSAAGELAGALIGYFSGRIFGGDEHGTEIKAANQSIDQNIKKLNEAQKQLTAGKISPEEALRITREQGGASEHRIRTVGGEQEERDALRKRIAETAEPLKAQAELAIATKKQADALSKAADISEHFNTIFGQLAGTIELANNQFNRAEAGLDNFTSALAGQITSLKIPTEKIPALGTVPQEQYSQIVQGITSQLGPLGTNLGNQLQDLNKISTDLPPILDEILRRGQLTGNTDPASTVANIVTERFGNIDKGVLNELAESIRGTLTQEKVEKNQLQPEQFTQQLIKPLEGRRIQIAEEANKNISTAINKFGENITKYQSFVDKQTALQDQLNDVALQRIKFETEIYARETGQRANAYRLISPETAQLPFLRAQERLTGFQGNAALDPRQIGNSLQETFDLIRQTEQRALGSRDTNTITQAIESLGGLNAKSRDLQKALENLTKTSGQLADIHDRLARLDKASESRYGLAEQYLTANPQEYRELETKRLTSAALLSGQVNLAQLTPDQRRGAFEYFRAGGENTAENIGIDRIGGLNSQRISTDILRSLIGAFPGPGQFAFNRPTSYAEGGASGRDLTERQGLEERERRVLQTSADAATALSGVIGTNNNDFLNRLHEEFTAFLAGLRQTPDVENQAFGGPIFKPRGTDTVPAMLTPGEFVINAGSAQKNLSLLHAINSGATYSADGGLINKKKKKEFVGPPEESTVLKGSIEEHRKLARQAAEKENQIRNIIVATDKTLHGGSQAGIYSYDNRAFNQENIARVKEERALERIERTKKLEARAKVQEDVLTGGIRSRGLESGLGFTPGYHFNFKDTVEPTDDVASLLRSRTSEAGLGFGPSKGVIPQFTLPTGVVNKAPATPLVIVAGENVSGTKTTGAASEFAGQAHTQQVIAQNLAKNVAEDKGKKIKKVEFESRGGMVYAQGGGLLEDIKLLFGITTGSRKSFYEERDTDKTGITGYTKEGKDVSSVPPELLAKANAEIAAGRTEKEQKQAEAYKASPGFVGPKPFAETFIGPQISPELKQQRLGEEKKLQNYQDYLKTVPDIVPKQSPYPDIGPEVTDADFEAAGTQTRAQKIGHARQIFEAAQAGIKADQEEKGPSLYNRVRGLNAARFQDTRTANQERYQTRRAAGAAHYAQDIKGRALLDRYFGPQAVDPQALERSDQFQGLKKSIGGLEAKRTQAQEEAYGKAGFEGLPTQGVFKQVQGAAKILGAEGQVQKDIAAGTPAPVGGGDVQTLQQRVAYLEQLVLNLSRGNQQQRPNFGVLRASGGPIGTDTVPAMLTPGEFVINAQATKQHYSLLNAINNSRGGPVQASSGGVIQHYQGGGAVGGGAEAFAGAATRLTEGFSSFRDSASVFLKAATDMGNVANILKNVNIPTEISIRREGTVQVILNGAEVLAAIKGDLQSYINNQIVTMIKNSQQQVADQPPAA